jgi:hypothetical protein
MLADPNSFGSMSLGVLPLEAAGLSVADCIRRCGVSSCLFLRCSYRQVKDKTCLQGVKEYAVRVTSGRYVFLLFSKESFARGAPCTAVLTQLGPLCRAEQLAWPRGCRRGLFEHVGALGRIVRVPQPPRSSRQHRVRANACAIPGWRSLWLLSLGQARESNRRPDVTRTTYYLRPLLCLRSFIGSGSCPLPSQHEQLTFG